MSVSLRQPVSVLALTVFLTMLLTIFVVTPLASTQGTWSQTGTVAHRIDEASAQQITGARASTTTRILTGIFVVLVVVLVVAACATPFAPVAGAAALQILSGWGGVLTYSAGAGVAACQAYGPCQ